MIYLLRDYIIVNRGSSAHICNSLDCIEDVVDVTKYLYAGTQVIRIYKIGIMLVNFTNANRKERIFKGEEAYYVPNFYTNCILEDCLNKKGF